MEKNWNAGIEVGSPLRLNGEEIVIAKDLEMRGEKVLSVHYIPETGERKLYLGRSDTRSTHELPNGPLDPNGRGTITRTL